MGLEGQVQERQAVLSGEPHDNKGAAERGPGLDSSCSERLRALFWAQKAQVYMRGRDRQGVAKALGRASGLRQSCHAK